MNVALWITAGILAALFFVSGVVKLIRSNDKLVEMGFGFAGDLSTGFVKSIGVLEVMAGIGLVLPALLDIAPVLVPVAAAGLVLLMIGAMITHVRRDEAKLIGSNLFLLALAAFVAWGRFGPHQFTG